jgi:ketosteroid isomerase-like protein
MSIEENRSVARELFARLGAGDVAGVLDLLADDATWWLAGKPGAIPVQGTMDKRRFARLVDTMSSQLKDGLRMTVKGLVAEGDRVAAEVESHGELRNGRVYEQQYHFLITFRAGNILAVREYLDTQHAFATWFA